MMIALIIVCCMLVGALVLAWWLFKSLRTARNTVVVIAKRDEALLSTVRDGVVAIDRNGKVMLFNKAAEEMLRVPAQNAIGRVFSDVWSIEQNNGQMVANQDRPMYKVMQSGIPLKTADYYCVRRDEAGTVISRFPIMQEILPVVVNGQTMGVVNVFSDIEHEKEIDHMKTEFISRASHQLRTPLSAIRWFTEMLLAGDTGPLTDDQKECAQDIYESTQRMIELVDSLLNISRVESGRIIIAPKPTDMTDLINRVVEGLKLKIDQKRQMLAISVHRELPKIDLDPILISQVYINLLSNAIKYTPIGGDISIFVSRNGDDLVSQITDSGYGIPKTQQDRVFQKFFRGDNAAKVETDGTGLGLYLVKAIIESSGGEVWFRSEEGEGTSFWFSLPMTGMKAQTGEVTLDGLVRKLK